MSNRNDLLKSWLAEVFATQSFELEPASEDASFRSYHRLSLQEKTYIVMDAPPPEEDCRPFVQITELLLASDIHVPTIHHKDLEQGFLVLDDFGNTLYLDQLNDSSADGLYKAAISAMVKIQSGANETSLPQYNEELLRREIGFFTEWLLDKHLKIELSHEQDESLNSTFTLLVDNALHQPQSFVHRDYHSRNLMVTETNSPGIIDYQDAVQGPISYDLVSLLKDCYIKWPRENINDWVKYYLQLKSEQNEEIDQQQFQRWFDLMGVQRHLKASGIFARLSIRDGKHHYLNDVPRTLSYIVDLKDDYQELSSLCTAIEDKVLPKLGSSY